MMIPREKLQTELSRALKKGKSFEEKKMILNEFKDREMFRIDLKHLMEPLENLMRFSKALTDLTEVVLEETYAACYRDLVGRYGTPSLENGNPSPFALFGLGKFGGKEMGFASDIELLLVYGGEGETKGKKPIENGEFYERLAREILSFVEAKRKGIFHIDLRLRPFGEKGALATSINFLRAYYAPGRGRRRLNGRH